MTADFETLNIEAPNGTIQGKPTKIANVIVRFENSRGLLIGPDVDNMVEMKQREHEAMSTPTALFTGDKEITLKPSWSSNGRFYMRQPYPLPTTILAVIPDIQVGS